MLKLYTVDVFKKIYPKYKKKLKKLIEILSKNTQNLVVEKNLTKYSYSNNH